MGKVRESIYKKNCIIISAWRNNYIASRRKKMSLLIDMLINLVKLFLKKYWLMIDNDIQAIILFSSLLRSCDNLTDTIIFKRSLLSIKKVKTTLKSRELKRQSKNSYGGSSFNESLSVQGRIEEPKNST